jgi:hypothetical protein
VRGINNRMHFSFFQKIASRVGSIVGITAQLQVNQVGTKSGW